MSAADIATLMGMGATRTQAIKALAKHKEVMEAAVFCFANEVGEGEKDQESETYDDEEEEDEESYYDDIDLVSEPDEKADFDPYKGISMSKEQTKLVIEPEQTPEKVTVILRGKKKVAKKMSQGQWMQGCPEGSEQSHLFALHEQFQDIKSACPSCREPTQSINEGLLLMFDSVEDYIEYIKETVRARCGKCKAAYCIACGTTCGTEKGAGEAGLWHCGELQAALVGVGLAHVQQLLEEPCNDSATGKASMDANSNKKTKHSVLGRPASSSGPNNGTGYAGEAMENRTWHAEHTLMQMRKDEILRQALERVRTFLPNVKRASPASSDFMPHIVTIAQIRRRLLPIVSRLLQSDSLVDMSERYNLYHEVMAEWFRAFASNEALVPLLAQPIFLPVKTEFILQKNKRREKYITYAGSSGPRELAQSIVEQCTVFLENLDRHHQFANKDMQEVNPTKENSCKHTDKNAEIEECWAVEEQRLRHFARTFIDEVAAIDKTLRTTKGDAFMDKLLGLMKESEAMQAKAVVADVVNSSREESSVEIARYEAWVKTQCYDECDMRQTSSTGVSTYMHVFDNKIQHTSSCSDNKRGFIIAKELAGLRVSLPTSWNGSIFLRVDESRIDVLKACIVGPEGSPYQNGLFMFDIYLPSSYNHTSPDVKIVTTGRGTVRHNPNLYADGKVCLSLLGTWSGPGWISGQSTLLQVLISIQSLVMGVEEPALNEPGWSTWAGKPASISYTKNCRRQTVAVAMLSHLKEPDSIWKDVIEGHFRLKARSLFRQLDKWLSEDDRNRQYGDGASLMHSHSISHKEDGQGKFQKDVAAIKQLLSQQH